MKNALFFAAVITVAAGIAFAVLLVPSPVPDRSREATSSPNTPTSKYSQNFADSLPVAARKVDLLARDRRSATTPTDASPMVQAKAGETKAQTLELIDAAMSTYSDEGLPALKSYLSHSDPDIRSATVEALKQLAVPQAADALRQAAKSARNDRERISMLEAAEFLELPRLPLSEVKKLLRDGTISMPAPTESTTAAP